MRYLSANQFEVYEEIGKGGFGVVYRGLDKVTKEEVAIKQINLEDTNDIEDLQKEINILSQCKLDQITKYYGCFVKGYKLWIIMEYLDGGSCLDLLIPGPFEEKHISILLKELLLALEYLHKNSRIHRDVKAANILINSKGGVKIADFGVSTQLSSNLSKRNTFVGSPYWMSPEVILEEEYNFKADIWSLGITAIELCTGKPPLSSIPPMKALFQIPSNEPPILNGDCYSSAFKDFVSLCLQRDPKKRPTAKKLLEHRFITRGGGNRKSLLELIQRKKDWIIANSNNRKALPKQYYSPTIDETVNRRNVIRFDFGDGEDEDDSTHTSGTSANVSSVVILKKTRSTLKDNTNILNNLAAPRDSNTKSISSNISTLRQTNYASAKRREIDEIFKQCVSKTQCDDLTQLNKLAEIGELMKGLDEEVLLTFASHFTKSFQSSSLNNSDNIIKTEGTRSVADRGSNSKNSKARSYPAKAESEKLLLKRWADQYFA